VKILTEQSMSQKIIDWVESIALVISLIGGVLLVLYHWH